jgi:hypothetical protein
MGRVSPHTSMRAGLRRRSSAVWFLLVTSGRPDHQTGQRRRLQHRFLSRQWTRTALPRSGDITPCAPRVGPPTPPRPRRFVHEMRKERGGALPVARH